MVRGWFAGDSLTFRSAPRPWFDFRRFQGRGGFLCTQCPLWTFGSGGRARAGEGEVAPGRRVGSVLGVGGFPCRPRFGGLGVAEEWGWKWCGYGFSEVMSAGG